ncbi:hypothetical protein ACFSL4_19430 [Streptomyces caeni]|uniref:Glycosyltransferase family 1 protein n=1 Tax=Streptomyces caeni TaxID=2307231 RepID=A0ABW4ISF9_9ACTN
MSPPVVLHLSNEPKLTPCSGFVGAFRRLQADGRLRHTATAPRADMARGGREAVFTAVKRAIADAVPDVVLVQCPQGYPFGHDDVDRLLRLLGGPRVVCWEGDAWGGNKRLPQSTLAWLHRADAVFTVAGGAQLTMLRAAARGTVHYVPNTFPLDLFPEQDRPAPPGDGAHFDVVTIGNNMVRAGLVQRVPGAWDRTRLVRGLRRLGCRLGVFGAGWRGPHACGPLPFKDQLAVVQDARLSVGWNHYGHYPGSFSNRLPICAAAGRVHVGQGGSGREWLPGPQDGLHLVLTPAEAVARVRDLLTVKQEELDQAGQRLRHWIHTRLTDVQSLQFMLGGFAPMPRPPDDPWLKIAAWESGAE